MDPGKCAEAGLDHVRRTPALCTSGLRFFSILVLGAKGSRDLKTCSREPCGHKWSIFNLDISSSIRALSTGI